MKGIKGEIINSNYEIQEKLAQGGFGMVFKARQLLMNRDVVIKIILHNPNFEHTLKERFFLEATAVSRLKHPNIITYYDFGQDMDGDYFLVMELLEGKSLSRMIKEESPLSLARTIHIAAQMADALHDAHVNGIVHRDVKPNNIFIVKRGQDIDFVKLIDFGILALQKISPQTHQTLELKELEHLTKSGIILGTPEYMAPEMITGKKYDFRLDQYALGLILYEMLTGYKPFEADSQIGMMIKHVKEEPIDFSKRSHGRNLPHTLERVVMKSLKTNPEDRFDSMLEFRYHLLRAAQSIINEESDEKTQEKKSFEESMASTDQLTTIQEINDHSIKKSQKKYARPLLLLFSGMLMIGIFVIIFSSVSTKDTIKNTIIANRMLRDSFLMPVPININESKPADISLRNSFLPDISQRRNFDHIPGQKQTLKINNKDIMEDKETGILSLNVSPWAYVKLNGKHLGKSPLRDIKVPAGKCTLILTHPDLESKKMTFMIKKGEIIKEFVEMTK